jgi:hypothetical protein
MPGRIIFRIKPEVIAEFRSAFSNPHIHDKKFDPQAFSLHDIQSLRSLLRLPETFPALELKPFIPQHNIVHEPYSLPAA